MSCSLARATALVIVLAAVAGCRSATQPSGDEPLSAYRLTGVEVRPIDRDAHGGNVAYVHRDTLRNQVAFAVRTHATQVSRGNGAGAAGDHRIGAILNPTVLGKSSLTVDRALRHRGVTIPANTNLLTVPAILDSFDGSQSDLLFVPMSPFVIGEVHLRPRAFTISPGEYTLTFTWETSEGELFSDVVSVFIDLTE